MRYETAVSCIEDACLVISAAWHDRADECADARSGIYHFLNDDMQMELIQRCPEQEGKYVPVQRFEHGLEEVEALELVYEKRVLLLVSGILDRLLQDR